MCCYFNIKNVICYFGLFIFKFHLLIIALMYYLSTVFLEIMVFKISEFKVYMLYTRTSLMYFTNS